MAVTDSGKTYYEIKEKRLGNISQLKLFNIMTDIDNRTNFMNIFRSFDLNNDVTADILFFTSYEVGDEDIWWDNISYKLYGTPKLWWIVALMNNIHNPFEDIEPGDNIKVLRDEYVYRLLKDIEELGSL